MQKVDAPKVKRQDKQCKFKHTQTEGHEMHKRYQETENDIKKLKSQKEKQKDMKKMDNKENMNRER